MRDSIEDTDFERFSHPDLVELNDKIPASKLYQLISFHQLNDSRCRSDPTIALDQVNPLQSQLVLEASLRIPSYWMNPAGRRRGLAKRAFRDVVPDEILSRRGKGSTTSYVMKIIHENSHFLRELMLDGHLVRRKLLDREKLESILTPQGLSKTTSIFGLLRSISTELWVHHYASHLSSFSRTSTQH